MALRFRLLYEGPLPAKASPKEKHAIRRAIHPQLAELWKQPPLVTLAERRGALEEKARNSRDVPLRTRRGNFEFVPLVSTRLKLVCHLDVLFLRPGPPGTLIGHGGDIDNRLKTLFDSLQIPNLDQIEGEEPEHDETPFFCLLEDDALITGVSVETDRLLKPEAERTPDIPGLGPDAPNDEAARRRLFVED